METPHTGYRVQSYSQPVKRYCQTLNLKENPELIAEYRKRHLKENTWPEILAGIREVGILEMEIYILGSRLFMIVETPLDFDWDEAMHTAPPAGMGRLHVYFPTSQTGSIVVREMAANGAYVQALLASPNGKYQHTKRGCKEIVGQLTEFVS